MRCGPTSSTIAGNIGPDWAPSALFIGQFGGAFVPTFTLTDKIITGTHWYACERFASGTTGNVVSGGHNLVQDDSCNPAASDLIVWDAGVGPLAANGGPTWTHALLPGSPAIDGASDVACPATDQRGVTRPQGSHCDIGAFEFVPCAAARRPRGGRLWKRSLDKYCMVALGAWERSHDRGQCGP